jgi:hypothetical protein
MNSPTDLLHSSQAPQLNILQAVANFLEFIFNPKFTKKYLTIRTELQYLFNAFFQLFGMTVKFSDYNVSYS